MKVKFSDCVRTSTFVTDPYLPAQINFTENPYENIRHVGIYYGDVDLLEFSHDVNSGELVEVVLTDCEHFKAETTEITCPNASNGTLLLNDCKAENHPGHFKTIVHPDGFKVLFSGKTPERYIKDGQIYFGLSDSDDLLEVRVTGLTANEATHVWDELKRGCTMRTNN